MILNLIPRSFRESLKTRIRNAVLRDPVSTTKYLPYEYGRDAFIIPKSPDANQDIRSDGLPMPPGELWVGGPTKEFYLYWGEKDVSKMLEIVKSSDFWFDKGDRILELGCREGRMIRHLKSLTEICEVWGTDISAEHIYWCKRHLDPPFHFATTTTIPHLPFDDSYFNFIYAGSVFTHIDDLAESWLLELRRILSPQGRLYITIHDKHTIELLDSCYNEQVSTAQSSSSEELLSTRKLSAIMHSIDVFKNGKDSNFGMFVIGRDTGSQVFYDIDHFRKTLTPIFDILSITEAAYSECQTAVLLKRKSDVTNQR